MIINNPIAIFAATVLLLVAASFLFGHAYGRKREREHQDKLYKIHGCLTEFTIRGANPKVTIVLDAEDGLRVWLDNELFVNYPGGTDVNIFHTNAASRVDRAAVWKRRYDVGDLIAPVAEINNEELIANLRVNDEPRN